LDDLERHLKPFALRARIDLWSDKRIKPGAKWQDEIAAALKRAKVAVLLVTPNFLASDFIAHHELPPLIEAAQKDGATIFWVPVSSSAYDTTDIAQYQAAISPDRPLDRMKGPAERNAAFVRICRRIQEAAGAPGRPTSPASVQGSRPTVPGGRSQESYTSRDPNANASAQATGKSKSPSVQRGERVLAGEDLALPDLLELVNGLKQERRFGLARKLLDRYAEREEVKGHSDLRIRLKFAQQRALCTYKDPDLPAEDRLDRALGILNAADPLATSIDQETLGQAGAIFKRKWELTASGSYLETSLAYYLRGHAQGVANDYGYTAINAAFVLDLLAASTGTAAASVPEQTQLAQQRRQQARAIREEIVQTLPTLAAQADKKWLLQTWWFLVTLGEAYFGLSDYPQAEEWLQKAAGLANVPDWERESTARQLATLLRLQQNPPDGEAALKRFLGGSYAAVTSVMRGKLGLALSGGGFRASLYHIGVLAKLAELDLLRSVECLSCVSGGSIIGAHYYLEVRHLLQTKRDGEITREDYIDLVRRVARDFLAGVQRNIRTRIAAEWLTNLKMIFVPDYSRTLRAGELYESEIFSRVQDGKNGERDERWLDRLLVRPKGDESFVPKDNNWRRSAKVPILVLNATTLNTGHNWQFTASWMGEPPSGTDVKIDANYRLRRMYYAQLPAGQQEIRLGHAVAASACVPGLFEPLSLSGLYESKDKPIVVRLVDGGVHDNQGIAALLDQDCTVILVSDASGQMDSQDTPSPGMLGVPLRSNSILQARVRASQFRELQARRRAGLLRGLMFVHLKQDLGAEPVDWVECQDRSEPVRRDPLLPYGIHREVQRRLSAIRTDLDSFSEAEAYALMTSAYCMTERALAQQGALDTPLPPGSREPWPFLAIEPLLKQPSANSTLMRHLQVADKLVFKVWMLSRGLQLVGGLALLALFAALAFLSWWHWSTAFFSLTVGAVLTTLVCLALGAAGWGPLVKAFHYRKTFQSILIGFGMGTLGWGLARLHLHVFDRWFLRRGQLKRLMSK
jgi:predicted acylesterase/phospholipase RssA